MIKHNLKDMVKGWFIGSFDPTVIKTDVCEVGVKNYKAGDYEEKHFHKIATEVTLIISGRIRMMDNEFGPGDIIVINPGEVTDFKALADVINVVVKIPGVANDKYFAD